MLVSKSDGITTEHENVRARDTNSFKKKTYFGSFDLVDKIFYSHCFFKCLSELEPTEEKTCCWSCWVTR